LKARNIAYWITTIVLAFCNLSGGAAETVLVVGLFVGRRA
jgi:hypothetical protein